MRPTAAGAAISEAFASGPAPLRAAELEQQSVDENASGSGGSRRLSRHWVGRGVSKTTLKLCADEGDVKGFVSQFHALAYKEPNALDDAKSEFIISLFSHGLEMDEHGEIVMRVIINHSHHQGVVEFLFKGGVPIPFEKIATGHALRTALRLDPEGAKAFRGEEKCTLLDNYIAVHKAADIEALRNDITFLTGHGIKFTECITQHRFVPHAATIRSIKDLITRRTYEGGARVVEDMRDFEHLVFVLGQGGMGVGAGKPSDAYDNYARRVYGEAEEGYVEGH